MAPKEWEIRLWYLYKSTVFVGVSNYLSCIYETIRNPSAGHRERGSHRIDC